MSLILARRGNGGSMGPDSPAPLSLGQLCILDERTSEDKIGAISSPF